MKRVALIFIIAFLLNLVWENLHSLLYDNYMGGEITEFILLRATLADAFSITIVALPFVFLPFLKGRSWIMILVLVAVSVGIELYALETARWTYNSFMPIIPVVGVGLTPAVQLGLLGYASFKTAEHVIQ